MERTAFVDAGVVTYPFVFYAIRPTSYIYTLSLHDALPIFPGQHVHQVQPVRMAVLQVGQFVGEHDAAGVPVGVHQRDARSEEHTSELQSQSKIVCRLLPEKIKAHGFAGPWSARRSSMRAS